MAITIMLALVAAFILAITLVPALVALLIRGEVAEKVWLIARTRQRYLPLLDRSLERPWRFIGAGLAFFVAAIPAFALLVRVHSPARRGTSRSLRPACLRSA
jgi:cobalt-zinc-cadmium resistance protein CzcA